jgi:hypothetical protein
VQRVRNPGLHRDIQPVAVPVDSPISDEPEVAGEALAFTGNEAIDPRANLARNPFRSELRA